MSQHRSPPPERARPLAGAAGLAIAAALYTLLSLFAWFHAWSGSFSRALPTGTVDPVQGVWFFAWALHVLEHPANPFYTHAIFAPAGANVLASNSTLALGVLFAPVTAVAGPIAAFSAAIVAAPVITATAACFAARRWVSWQPAAFAAGLCYGFGPFAANEMRPWHLDLTFLAVPPLVLVCLDELLVRRTPHQVRTGAALGALVVVQFFVSTEVEAVTALTVVIGLALVAVAAPREVAARLRAAGRGLLTAAGLAIVVLAYPFFLAVAGPGHIHGPVFASLPQLSSTVVATVLPHAEGRLAGFLTTGNDGYLGFPLVALLAAAAVVWWRDRWLRLALAMTAVAFVLTLGYTLHVTTADTHVPLPAWLLGRVPLLDSVAAVHVAAFLDLFAALSLALVLDRIRRGDVGVLGARAPGRAAGAVAVALAMLVVVSFVPVWAWPYRVGRAAVPVSLRRPPISTAAARDVLVEYPEINGVQADAMLWQAMAGLPYTLHDGYAMIPAPGGGAIVNPQPDAVGLVFAAAELGRLPSTLSRATLAALRAALASDGASLVLVLPNTRQSATVVADLTAAIGRPSRTLPGGGAIWDLLR